MILVTGGLGMIGAHTARALVDLGHEVVVTSHRRTDVPSFLAGKVSVEHLDVTDREAFLALNDRYGISDIVHLAGSIPRADPVEFFRTDTGGLLNALDAARTWGVRRFAVASSLGVYLGRAEIPWYEDLALPTANLPHPIVALYISAVLRDERPRPRYADDGGDCCYAPDAGRAIGLLMTAETLRHHTYNVSSGRPVTNRDLVDALRAVNPGVQLRLLPGRQNGPGADPHLDITQLTQDTGFVPAFDIATAVADYVRWRAGNLR